MWSWKATTQEIPYVNDSKMWRDDGDADGIDDAERRTNKKHFALIENKKAIKM